MKVTGLTRDALRIRKEERDFVAAGWEKVDERGGKLWELYRGHRLGWKITDVRIAADGMSLWIKTADSVANSEGPSQRLDNVNPVGPSQFAPQPGFK